MTTFDSRTFDAATRLLAAAAAREPVNHSDADGPLAAFLVGRGGGAVPAFRHPHAQAIHEMAAAFGAGRGDDAIRSLDAALDAEDRVEVERPSALIHACHLGGEGFADQILDAIYRYPGNYVLGRMLVRTSRPEALLGVYGKRTDDNAAAAVGELVLRYRDAGVPFAPAETAWGAIEAAWPEGDDVTPGDVLALRARMAVRTSLEAGIERLVRGPASYQWEALPAGVIAVIARLVRVDPEFAVRIVRGTHKPKRTPREPEVMARWVRALTWWFEVPEVAVPVVEECIGAGSPERRLDLVAGLVGARALPLLDRAIDAAGAHPPGTWARTLGAEAKRLREAGHEADAEPIRERMARVAATDLDLYDVRAAPAAPRTAPWLHGADLP